MTIRNLRLLRPLHISPGGKMPNARLRFRQIYPVGMPTFGRRSQLLLEETQEPTKLSHLLLQLVQQPPQRYQILIDSNCPENIVGHRSFFPNSAILGSFPPPPAIPAVPEKPAKPSSGPGSVADSLKVLVGSDAGFEVLLGQGRILTLRDKLTVPGKTAP
jgi:hypothetical protein